jgi:hypothetical protein
LAINADFAQILIHTARNLYIDEDFGIELDNTVYNLDSTTIDLCLSPFPWARFRKYKGAIKLHALLDVKSNIPSYIEIADGKVHDAVNILDELIPEPGSFYIMDRAYVDFLRLYILNQCLAFFVIRAKTNLQWIKQHLRIKSFYDTTINAVKTQIWIAISVYVLVAISKKRLELEHSLYTILQILSITVFEKMLITQVLTDFGITNQLGDVN